MAAHACRVLPARHFDHAEHCRGFKRHPFALVKAFRAAFGVREDVLLVLKVSGTKHAAASHVLEALGRAAGNAHIRVVTKTLAYEEMLSLVRSADVYVSPHRPEGLSLGLLGAMTLGVPCIATAYGGNVDFMSHGNAQMISFNMVDVRCPVYRRLLGDVARQWAEPDLHALVSAMRELQTAHPCGHVWPTEAKRRPSAGANPFSEWIGSTPSERRSCADAPDALSFFNCPAVSTIVQACIWHNVFIGTESKVWYLNIYAG